MEKIEFFSIFGKHLKTNGLEGSLRGQRRLARN